MIYERLEWAAATTWIKGTSSTWVTLTGGAENLSDAVDLATKGYHGAEVQVEADMIGSPTNDLEVRVYVSLDGTIWDEVPRYSFVLDSGEDEKPISFRVENIPYFKLGFYSGTDVHKVRAQVREFIPLSK